VMKLSTLPEDVAAGYDNCHELVEPSGWKACLLAPQTMEGPLKPLVLHRDRGESGPLEEAHGVKAEGRA
jgi:hypothetical protein